MAAILPTNGTSDSGMSAGSFAEATYVQEIWNVVGPLARNPLTQERASKMYGELAGMDLRKLRGSPDEWFNLVTSAARSRNYTSAEKILEVAIDLHPDDADLRCEWFQFAYGHGSMAEALEAREELENLGPDKTYACWRYWCYNSTFESQFLHDKERAVEILDQGLSHVPLAGLLNIYRNYRLALIDGATRPSLTADPSVTDHAAVVARVEEKYRAGLSLGIESGYALAVDLAKLLRERTSGMPTEDADQILDEALRQLDIAERTYTDDGNHPLWDIYKEKAITLMARRRYEDALQIFRSLPGYLLNDSTTVMARYAANMTGQEFRPAGQSDGMDRSDELAQRIERLERTLGELLSALHANTGE